jgi:acyl carrier protein
MSASTPNTLTEIQSNEAKLQQAFANAFAIPLDPAIQEMAYGQVACWDSTAHMVLVAEIEAAFEVLLTTDDVIDLSSYRKAREILGKYGVAIEDAH